MILAANSIPLSEQLAGSDGECAEGEQFDVGTVDRPVQPLEESERRDACWRTAEEESGRSESRVREAAQFTEVGQANRCELHDGEDKAEQSIGLVSGTCALMDYMTNATTDKIP